MNNNNYGANEKLKKLEDRIKAIEERTACFLTDQAREISEIKIQMKEIKGNESACNQGQVFTASRGNGYGVWWNPNNKDNVSERFVGSELGAEIEAILTALMQAKARGFNDLIVNVGSNITLDAVNNVRKYRWWSEVTWSDKLALSSIRTRAKNIKVTWNRQDNLHVIKLANGEQTKPRKTWS